MNNPNAAVVYDFETGGIELDYPNTQLAAIAFDSITGKELSSFNDLIQFDESACDPKALEINHYNREKWHNLARPESEVVIRFHNWLEDFRNIEMISKRTGNKYYVTQLMGYNCISFDAPRLKRMFGRQFLPASPVQLDVFQLVRWWCKLFPTDAPPGTKLIEACNYFGVSVDTTAAHDALVDVRATAALFIALKDRLCTLRAASESIKANSRPLIPDAR